MSEKTTPSTNQATAFHELFDETAALFHRLRWAAETLHPEGGPGRGCRARHGAPGSGDPGAGRGRGRRRERGRGRGITAARRGILRSLQREGSRTVPELARARRVSRQHIQIVVNSLEESGLVRLEDNPSHKRSRLVTLTQRGAEALDVMLEREMELLGTLETPVEAARLREAAEVLRVVRAALEASPALEGTLDEEDPE